MLFFAFQVAGNYMYPERTPVLPSDRHLGIANCKNLVDIHAFYPEQAHLIFRTLGVFLYCAPVGGPSQIHAGTHDKAQAYNKVRRLFSMIDGLFFFR